MSDSTEISQSSSETPPPPTPWILAPSSRPSSPFYSDAPDRLAAAYTLFDASRRLAGSLHECKSSGGGIPELLSAGMRGAWRVSPWAQVGVRSTRAEEGGLPGDEEEWEKREEYKRDRRERREEEKREKDKEGEVVVVVEATRKQQTLTASLSAGKVGMMVGMMVGKSVKGSPASAGKLYHSPAERSNAGRSLGEDEEILFEAGYTQLAFPTTQPSPHPAPSTPHHLVPLAATSTPFLALASTSTPFLASTSTPFLAAPLPHPHSSRGPIPPHSQPLKRASTGLDSRRPGSHEEHLEGRTSASGEESAAGTKRAASGEAPSSSSKRRSVRAESRPVARETSAAASSKVESTRTSPPAQVEVEEPVMQEQEEGTKARGFASLLSEGDGESEMEGAESISRFLDEED